jgi:hypothetical protein
VKKIFAAASGGAYKLGLIACLIHLLMSWWIIFSVLTSSRDAQWQFIWIFLLPFDLPFSLLVLFAGYIFPGWHFSGLYSPWDDFHSFVLPVIVYGIIGPLWYFFLPVYVDGLLTLKRRSSLTAKS